MAQARDNREYPVRDAAILLLCALMCSLLLWGILLLFPRSWWDLEIVNHYLIVGTLVTFIFCSLPILGADFLHPIKTGAIHWALTCVGLGIIALCGYGYYIILINIYGFWYHISMWIGAFIYGYIATKIAVHLSGEIIAKLK